MVVSCYKIFLLVSKCLSFEFRPSLEFAIIWDILISQKHLVQFPLHKFYWNHIEPSSTSLKMMKFKSLLPHVNYLNDCRVFLYYIVFFKDKNREIIEDFFLSLFLFFSLWLKKMSRIHIYGFTRYVPSRRK